MTAGIFSGVVSSTFSFTAIRYTVPPAADAFSQNTPAASRAHSTSAASVIPFQPFIVYLL